MKLIHGTAACALAAAAAACVVSAARAQAIPVPAVAHHQHLLSPYVGARAARNHPPPVELPAELADVLRRREAAWNDSVALAPLLTPEAVAADPQTGRWYRGRSAVASALSQVFARSFTITPVSFAVNGPDAQVAGYLTRTVDGRPSYFGDVLLALRKGEDGAWRIAAESLAFPGGFTPAQITADQLIAQMDELGVRRAVVLSLGYVFGSPAGPRVENEYEMVKAENDWTARQAARFPDRLVAFCGVNPLKDYAVAEIERCARELHMRGVKLHFANSRVDVRNPEHVEKVRAVFRAANRLRLPIVAHLWTRAPDYGREHSEIFLRQILPEAPDVVVQIAHMADAGPGFTADAALAPLAEAVAAGDPRARNLYFDVTSNVTIDSPRAQTEILARRIRQIGAGRILFGSDGAWGGNPPMRQAWAAFVGMMPLTADELRTIAGNVAPYLR